MRDKSGVGEICIKSLKRLYELVFSKKIFSQKHANLSNQGWWRRARTRSVHCDSFTAGLSRTHTTSMEFCRDGYTKVKKNEKKNIFKHGANLLLSGRK